jgi:hypothetical protein
VPSAAQRCAAVEQDGADPIVTQMAVAVAETPQGNAGNWPTGNVCTTRLEAGSISEMEKLALSVTQTLPAAKDALSALIARCPESSGIW